MFAKYIALIVLLTGLIACDNQDAQKLQAPPPVLTPIVTQPVPPEGELKPVPAPGLSVLLQKGQITFELPPGFSDQTKLSGIINDNKSILQLFLNSKSRQRTVTSEELLPKGIKLSNSDTLLKELTHNMMTELSDRYQNTKQIKEESLTISKQKFYRLDTEQSVNGQKVISTILLTVLNKQVVTLQMLSPTKTPEVHHVLVQRTIDTLQVK